MVLLFPGSRRGIELAVNTLVVITLGIVILGAGFLFLKSIISGADDVLRVVDRDTQAEISGLLARGELVAVPRAVRTDARVDTPEYFGIGIKNTLDKPHEFVPKVILTERINTDGSSTRTGLPSNTVFMKNYTPAAEHVQLEPYGVKTDIPIAITIPQGQPKGTYIYNVTVYANIGSGGCSTLALEQACIYGQKQLRITIR